MKWIKYFESYQKERTEWVYRNETFKLGDVIDGSRLDELSGGNVGNTKYKYRLVQKQLSDFPDSEYNRQELLKLDKDYIEEENYRLDSMKSNFDKTPPIPEEGDGFHRIVVAKELGYDTILMWEKF